MSRRAFVASSLYILAMLVLGVPSTSCGSSSTRRVLQSIDVAPTTANAQDFASGQVQFVATGKFSQPPSPAPVTFVAPYSGSWSSSNTNVATINQNGMAQCLPVASGPVTITAIASTNSAKPPAMSTA